MRRLVLSIAVVAYLVSVSLLEAKERFEKIRGIEQASVSRAGISPLNKNIVYAASTTALFVSRDKGLQWQKVFVAKSDTIVDIHIDTYVYDVVYIATQRRIYEVSENKVRQLFSLPPQIQARCIRAFDGTVYVGTNEGIYTATGTLPRAKRLSTFSKSIPVSSVAFTQKKLLIASPDAVYLENERGRFRKVFALKRVDTEEDVEPIAECRHLAVSIFDEKKVYLATSHGLYASVNGGSSWNAVREPLVESADIRMLAQVDRERHALYLATDRGVILYNDQTHAVSSLFEGLPTRNIWWITFDSAGQLYAATDRGLFVRAQSSQSSSFSQIDELLQCEPPICEVQQVALKYNQVHPDKVRRWRNALKYRALFPTVDLDYDKTVTYDSGLDRYMTGPHDWGVGLSWNLGELIWNSHQDDVDTRERLITQLRINILDDINTVYFERLRLKQVIASGAPGSEAERTKNELRLRELRAILDGYTGGFYSQRLSELNQNTYSR